MKEYYRVKTEKELEESFGKQWRNILRPIWAKEMDYLCGQKLNDSQTLDYIDGTSIITFNCKDKYPEREQWYVDPQAIIKVDSSFKIRPKHLDLNITANISERGKITVNYGAFTGVAKCHPNDDFDLQKGLAVAFARLARQLGEYEVEKEKTIVVKQKVKCNILDEL